MKATEFKCVKDIRAVLKMEFNTMSTLLSISLLVMIFLEEISADKSVIEFAERVPGKTD